MPGYYDALIMGRTNTHKKKAKKARKAIAQPPSPPIQAEKEAVDINTCASDGINSDNNSVSSSTIAANATEEQRTVMPTVPTGKMAKKAAPTASAKKVVEAPVQPAGPPIPPRLTYEEALHMVTGGDGFSSDDTNLSIVDSAISNGALEERRMAAQVVAQQEQLSKGAAAARPKELAAPGKVIIDTDWNTAIITAAITKIVFASTHLGYGASQFVPKAASCIFVKEHIVAGSSLLAALFLVLNVSCADIVTNCRTCVRTLSRFIDVRDREELAKLGAFYKGLCGCCDKALLEIVVDVADELLGSSGVKWIDNEQGQQEDENDGYEAEDEQTEV